MINYLDFIDGVLLCRAARDMDSPNNPSELWLDIELETIEADSVWTDEEKQELILTAKFAELIDDRKAWLLKEIQDERWQVAA